MGLHLPLMALAGDASPGGRAPRAVAVRLTLGAGRRSDEERQELALGALAAALAAVADLGSPAWTVQAVAGSRLRFVLTPLPGQELAQHEVWEMIYALRAQPGVAWAGPDFT